MTNAPRTVNDQLGFLDELIDANSDIAGVLQVSTTIWAIHARIAVDGSVLVAEFSSREEADAVLSRLAPNRAANVRPPTAKADRHRSGLTSG